MAKTVIAQPVSYFKTKLETNDISTWIQFLCKVHKLIIDWF